VELALGRGEEELARFAARKLLVGQRTQTARDARSAGLARERADLLERLTRQEKELEELRERVRARLSEDATRGEEGPCPAPIAEHDVSLELLRRRARGGES
jgi:hypothetical protein